MRLVVLLAVVLTVATGCAVEPAGESGAEQAADQAKPSDRPAAPKATRDEPPEPPSSVTTSEAAPSLTPAPSTATPQLQSRYFPVTAVVDGDTVKVARRGETTIRIIGIDTPETVDPNSPVECGGLRASALASTLLDGQDVRLVFDLSQGRTDAYDRTLAYVETRAGFDFGLTMIKRGAAAEYTYDTAYQRQGRYDAAEQAARAQGEGLWDLCGGPHVAPTTPEPTAVEPEPTEAPAAGGCADGYQPCVPPFPPDVNCDDVGGPITVTGSDPHGLDADDDGMACES